MDELFLGEMGIPYLELELMTARSLMNKVRGYEKRSEREYREQWERTRMISYYSFCPIDPSDPEKKNLVPMMEWMPFQWDTEVNNDEVWEKTKAHAMKLKEESDQRWAKLEDNLKKRDVEQ
nr:hypothetical protein [Allomuricauda sp.]